MLSFLSFSSRICMEPSNTYYYPALFKQVYPSIYIYHIDFTTTARILLTCDLLGSEVTKDITCWALTSSYCTKTTSPTCPEQHGLVLHKLQVFDKDRKGRHYTWLHLFPFVLLSRPGYSTSLTYWPFIEWKGQALGSQGWDSDVLALPLSMSESKGKKRKWCPGFFCCVPQPVANPAACLRRGLEPS